MALRAHVFLLFWILGTAGDVLLGITSVNDAAYIPNFKTKYGISTVTEDAIATSPYAIVICDGVSEPSFNTGFLANYLAKYGAMYTLEEVVGKGLHPESTEGFRVPFQTALNGIRGAYFQRVDKAVADWAARTHTQTVPQTIMNVASTFMAAFVEVKNKESVLNVVQKGDGVLMVYRLVPSTANPGKFHYKLIYVTREQQSAFNTPFNVGVSAKETDRELFIDSLKLQEGDIVVMGSDGVSDNLHANFMSYMVNYIVAAAQTQLTIKEIVRGLTAMRNVFRFDADSVDQTQFPIHGQEGQANGRRLSRYQSDFEEAPPKLKKESNFMEKLGNLFGCGKRDDSPEKQPPQNRKAAQREREIAIFKYLDQVVKSKSQSMHSNDRKPLADFAIDELLYEEDDPLHAFNRVSKISGRNKYPPTIEGRRFYKDMGEKLGAHHLSPTESNDHPARPTIGTAIGQVRKFMQVSEIFPKNVALFDALDAQGAKKGAKGEQRVNSADHAEFSIDRSDLSLEAKTLGRSIPPRDNQRLAVTMEDMDSDSEKHLQQIPGTDHMAPPSKSEPELDVENFVSEVFMPKFEFRAEESARVFDNLSQEDLLNGCQAFGFSESILPAAFEDSFDRNFDFGDDEIELFARKFETKQVSAIFAMVARAFAECDDCFAPFRATATRWKRPIRTGGKFDDISVVVTMAMDYKKPSKAAMDKFLDDLLDKTILIDEALKAHVNFFLDFYANAKHKISI